MVMGTDFRSRHNLNMFPQEQNDGGAMAVLERLLEEFFAPTTGNARKQEIEAQLGQVRGQPQFGKFCLYVVANSGSQFATMFALSCLEVRLAFGCLFRCFYSILKMFLDIREKCSVDTLLYVFWKN